MRMPRVSAFFPDVTQQIHSLRASDEMLPHFLHVAAEEASAFRKSSGSLCTDPEASGFMSYDSTLGIFPTRWSC